MNRFLLPLSIFVVVVGFLGIGLTLVRYLVEMHGGRVDVFSPGTGQGAEFVVRLPVLTEVTPQTPPDNVPVTREIR